MPEIGTYSLSGGRRPARKRASSDPTAMKHHLACCSLKLDGRVTISRETHENGQQAKLLQGNDTTVGWISRKKPRIRSRENFFLDIPFYRTHWLDCDWCSAANTVLPLAALDR